MIIRYDEGSSEWIARSSKRESFSAKSEAMAGSLLLGTRTWTVANDTCGTYYSRKMTMSPCNDSQFTCQDGNCIGMSNRCDGKVQCKDGSGEESKIKIEKVLKFSPPFGIKNNSFLHSYLQF